MRLRFLIGRLWVISRGRKPLLLVVQLWRFGPQNHPQEGGYHAQPALLRAHRPSSSMRYGFEEQPAGLQTLGECRTRPAKLMKFLDESRIPEKIYETDTKAMKMTKREVLLMASVSSSGKDSTHKGFSVMTDQHSS